MIIIEIIAVIAAVYAMVVSIDALNHIEWMLTKILQQMWLIKTDGAEHKDEEER